MHLTVPSQGNNVAINTNESNARVKLSNSIRTYFMAGFGLSWIRTTAYG